VSFQKENLGEAPGLVGDRSQKQLDLIGEALDASADGFSIWQAIRDERGRITDYKLIFINIAGAAITEHVPSQLVGKRLPEVVGEAATPPLRALITRALVEQQTVKELVHMPMQDGSTAVYENTVVALLEDQVLSTYRDVSEERREHGRLVWLTEHDYLTGMPNRVRLQKFLAASVLEASAGDEYISFVFIDIDHFKDVNDTFGHNVGDELLVNFIKRIRHSLPEESLVARISGDEFAIVLRDVRNEDHLRELMDEVFGAMKRKFVHGDIELEITCSAGCVLTDGSVNPDEVIRIADKAMYEAKHRGRNQYLVETRLRAI
jgi:diguanylate cyclase (GGDEF)-like protein